MPTGETAAGGFPVYCNGVPMWEITEVRLPELSEEEREAISTHICGQVQLLGECDLSAIVAAFPVDVRYIWHCLKKGWEPSLRGLQGFIKMERLGYYKTL